MASEKPCWTEQPARPLNGQCKFQSPELATSFEMRATTRRPPQWQVLRSVPCNGLSGRLLRRPLPAQRDAGLRVIRLRPGRQRMVQETSGEFGVGDGDGAFASAVVGAHVHEDVVARDADRVLVADGWAVGVAGESVQRCGRGVEGRSFFEVERSWLHSPPPLPSPWEVEGGRQSPHLGRGRVQIEALPLSEGGWGGSRLPPMAGISICIS